MRPVRPVGARFTGAVVVASNRAAAGVYADRCGPLITDALRQWGIDAAEPQVVPDGPEVGRLLREEIAAGTSLVITTGGTGVTPTDRTPEETAPLIDRLVPGIAEAIRAAGVAQGVPTAMLSRGLAGFADETLIVNLPGSSGGVRDALAVLEPVITHALDQARGGDHE